jgi:hypothetical protein
MDADVMITIAFCLEVFLFALAGGLLVAHEVGKSRSEAAAEAGRARLGRADVRTRRRPSAPRKVSGARGAEPVTTREGRAVRGLRS